MECGEDDELRFRHEVARLLQRLLDLPLLQRRVRGAEADDHALVRARGIVAHAGAAAVVRARLGLGVQPARAGQRLDPGKHEVLPALAADARAEKFRAPFLLPEGFAFTSEGS